ncbi:MAG: glycosyltransferase, partial [Planctomycetes bacterium]|nr:glycosyltransferase [Planctomycetota bacterium]
MANTRIVLLIPTLDRSGAEKQFTLLATQLPKDEFDVHAVILTRGGPYEVDLSSSSIPVTIIGKRSKFDPTAFWRLRRELKRLDPDILHTWLFAANAYGRLASSVVPRAKIVVSERCVDTWKAGWQLWLDRRLIESTDRMVGNSQGVVDFYHSMGVPLEKLVCIPNGIELARSSNHRTEATANSTVIQIRKQLHSELGLPDDAFVAGFVGRLAKQKRVEDLIWAVETLRQIRPQLHLVLIGDGPERERLKRFANDIHCTDHIRFLGHLDDATRYFPAFDVFCLASSFEGMSNSVMEAMVAG